jgi:hypothetical protein
VLGDPAVRALHLSLLSTTTQTKDELRRNYLEGLELRCRHKGVAALEPRQKRELLLDDEMIRSLVMNTNGTMPSKLLVAR